MSVSNTDLTIGFDPTGTASVTGAQLAQMVTGAAPYADKGLIVTTTDVNGTPDVPSVSTYAKLARYMWLRISPAVSAVTAYVWNPGQSNIIQYTTTGGVSGTIDTNWIPISGASLGVGAVQSANIADGSITTAKISSAGIDAAKITGSITDPTSVKLVTVPNGPTTTVVAPAGVIGGSYTAGLTLLKNAVATDNIQDLAITNPKIAAKTIANTKLAGTTTLNQVMLSDGIDAVTWNTRGIVAMADPVLINVGLVPKVTGAGIFGLGQVGFKGANYNLQIRSLSTYTTPSYQVSVKAGAITLESPYNGIVIVNNVDLTPDFTTIGAKNGTDQSAVSTTGQWYYIWVCLNVGENTAYAVFSASSTAPSTFVVPNSAYVSMVGVVAVGNGTDKVKPFVQLGNKVYQQDTMFATYTNITTQTTNVWTEYIIDPTVSGFIPPNALTMFGRYCSEGQTGTEGAIGISGGFTAADLVGVNLHIYPSINVPTSWTSVIGWTGFTKSIAARTIKLNANFDIPFMGSKKMYLMTRHIAAGITVISSGFTI